METTELILQDFDLINDFKLNEDLNEMDENVSVEVSGLGNVGVYQYNYTDICRMD